MSGDVVLSFTCVEGSAVNVHGCQVVWEGYHCWFLGRELYIRCCFLRGLFVSTGLTWEREGAGRKGVGRKGVGRKEVGRKRKGREKRKGGEDEGEGEEEGEGTTSSLGRIVRSTSVSGLERTVEESCLPPAERPSHEDILGGFRSPGPQEH